MENQIERLKKNTTVFGEMPNQEDKEFLEEHIDHLEWRSDKEWEDNDSYELQEKFAYRLKQDFNPEPEGPGKTESEVYPKDNFYYFDVGIETGAEYKLHEALSMVGYGGIYWESTHIRTGKTVYLWSFEIIGSDADYVGIPKKVRFRK